MNSGYQINQEAITCIYHYLLVILSMWKVFMGCVDVWKQAGRIFTRSSTKCQPFWGCTLL